MVAQAAHDLPPAEQHVFVLRADMTGYEDVANELKSSIQRRLSKLLTT